MAAGGNGDAPLRSSWFLGRAGASTLTRAGFVASAPAAYGGLNNASFVLRDFFFSTPAVPVSEPAPHLFARRFDVVSY